MQFLRKFSSQELILGKSFYFSLYLIPKPGKALFEVTSGAS